MELKDNNLSATKQNFTCERCKETFPKNTEAYYCKAIQLSSTLLIPCLRPYMQRSKEIKERIQNGR